MNDHIPEKGDQDGFQWQDHWYPVCFVQDFPESVPYRFSLYDYGLVLFRDSSGEIRCLKDLCPHRCARLSDGEVIDGHVECLYHGWQFDGSGACAHIPQWSPEKAKPQGTNVTAYAVHVHQGLIWVWPGEPGSADQALIPSAQGFDEPGVNSIDFMMDLPYDQSYLIENVIDVAHIHIAHSGVKGGGLRRYALPLEFEILENDMRGIRATFRSVGIETGREQTRLRGAHVAFVAPNTIAYRPDYLDASLSSGLALYSAPLGKQRCRLLYRAYSNFWPRRDRLVPRWIEHSNQCLLLEQDMGVVAGQHEEIEQDGRPLTEQWAPIKSSDTLVLAYRRWLDRHGQGLPFYRGLTTAKNSAAACTGSQAHDRFTLHTQICGSCSRAHRVLKHVQVAGLWAGLMLLPLAQLTASPTLAACSLLILTSALVARQLKTRLETSPVMNQGRRFRLFAPKT